MRLFIAIGLDDPVKDLLCRAQRQLKRQALGGRFSRRESLHLTLAFLGEAPDIRRAAIALDQIQAAPFSLAVQGLGYFPSAEGQTWWMGTAPCPPLAALHRQLCRQLRAQGFSLEDRPFRPHLTLGRGIRLPAGFDSQALGPVFISMAIQTGFAAAVFSVALVISKFRRQRTEGFASIKTEMA